MYPIYLCAINVNDYVILRYEGSMHTQYYYIMFIRKVNVNLKVDIEKFFNYRILTYECKNIS